MTPAPTANETAAERRRRIVAAARERFLASGFGAATMDEIARDLGMSKKTLYEHFPGKLELLRAASKLGLDECEAEFRAIGAQEPDFFARARRTFAWVARVYSRMSPAYLTDLKRSAPRVWAEVRGFRQEKVRRHILELIDRGVAQGVLRADLDREALARLYLTTTTALLTPEISGRTSGAEIGADFEVFARVYLEGLLSEAGRRRLSGRRK